MEKLSALTQRLVKENREAQLKLELEQKGYISPGRPLTKKAMLQFIEPTTIFGDFLLPLVQIMEVTDTIHRVTIQLRKQHDFGTNKEAR